MKKKYQNVAKNLFFSRGATVYSWPLTAGAHGCMLISNSLYRQSSTILNVKTPSCLTEKLNMFMILLLLDPRGQSGFLTFR